MRILFTDTETTGLSAKPNMNEVVQVAGILTDNRTVIESIFCKSQPVNWDKVNKQALAVTNLTIPILKTYEVPKVAFDSFYQFIINHFDGTKIKFGGQKTQFDIKFIKLWWDTWKSPEQLPIESIFDMNDYFDLLDLTKPLKDIGLLLVDNLKLKTIGEALNLIPKGDLHDAFTDIELTYRSTFDLIDRVNALNNQDITEKIGKFMALR